MGSCTSNNNKNVRANSGAKLNKGATGNTTNTGNNITAVKANAPTNSHTNTNNHTNNNTNTNNNENKPKPHIPRDISVTVKLDNKILQERIYKSSEEISNIIIECSSQLPKYPADSFTCSICENTDNSSPKIFVTYDTTSDLQTNKQLYTLIPDESKSITLQYKLKGLKFIPENTTPVHTELEYLSKPIDNPFQISHYMKEQQGFTIEEYNEEIISQNNLDYYSPKSAYCSGYNRLFISGGSYKDKDLAYFWEIDVKTQTVKVFPNGLKTPRKVHSMIVIPASYVFIVGGSTSKMNNGKLKTEGAKDVEYYTISHSNNVNNNNNSNDLFKYHSTMNYERSEPALALINHSILYAFTGFTDINNNSEVNSFEFINLRGDNKKWEIVKPKIDAKLGVFDQVHFAACAASENEVIFLGGSKRTAGKNGSDEGNSFSYNHESKEITGTNVRFQRIELNEKNFYQLGMRNFFIIPDELRDSQCLWRYTTQQKLVKVEFDKCVPPVDLDGEDMY